MKKLIKYFLIFTAVITVLGFIFAQFPNEEINISKDVQTETSTKKVGHDNYDFSKVTISAYKLGSNKIIDKKVVKARFNKKKDPSGLIVISSTESPIRALYYDETPMTTLSIMLNEDDATRWRKNKGHDIFKIEKDGKLTFIFSDKKIMKGTLIFEK